MESVTELTTTQLSLDDLLSGLRRVVIVVPCSAAKREQDRPAGIYSYPAGELYLGQFHTYARNHAARLGADVLILSAGSGLLELDQQIAPYDKRITDADSIAYNAGPRIVADQVAALDLNNPETIVVSFCPAAYTAELVKAIPTLRTPLAGSRGIGEQRGRIARLTRDELLG